MHRDTDSKCTACNSRGGQAFRTDFTMAFQPIFDAASGAVFAQEALVRPIGDGSAWDVLREVTETNRYNFDQKCRTRAIEVAAGLGLDTRLSINFMPNAVYDPEHCIQATLRAAEKYAFPIERLVFEFTETETVRDTAHLMHIVDSYRNRGFLTALDDFGAGYAGLGLLCDVKPDIVKIDIALIRGISADARRRRIVEAIHRLCADLHILVVAEGIEGAADAATLRAIGIDLLQGYLFARPAYERLVGAAEIQAAMAAVAA